MKRIQRPKSHTSAPSASGTLRLGATILAAVVAAGSGSADSYQFEGGIEYVSGEVSVGDGYSPPDYTPPPVGDPGFTPPTGTPEPEPPVSGTQFGPSDYDGWVLSGTWYVGGVDTTRGPLRLAPFVSRANSIGAEIGQIDLDSGGDADFWFVDSRWVLPNGIILEADYGQREAGSADADVARIAGGYYFGDTSAVRVGYDTDDDDFSELERWSIDITHVQTLENGTTFSVGALIGLVTGEDGLGRDDDGSDVVLTASYFPQDNFGFGLEALFSERDASGDANAWELWADYFVTEKISLTLAYRDEDGDIAEGDTLSFEARYRF
ncbi:MAG: putative porin [Pseudomonadaceae bacterium]|nr:putative porin [Pseudomonadaceae bacterium]